MHRFSTTYNDCTQTAARPAVFLDLLPLLSWHKSEIDDHGSASGLSEPSVAARIIRGRKAVIDDIFCAGTDVLEFVQTFLGKPSEKCADYDVDAITRRRRLLKGTITKGDTEELLCYFRSLITRNVGGIANECVGAPDVDDRKHTFNRYKQTVLQTTAYIQDLFDGSRDRDERVHIYQYVCDTISEFGKSATLLSGGGTLGMYHIGILKAFRETHPRLISQVISGASAGSIVAAVFASKKDEDLDDAVERLCHGDLNVFLDTDEQQMSYLDRIRTTWSRRTLYDPKNLRRVMQDLLGEKLTFKDAFNLTGKRLNITVTTSESEKGNFRLLNHITSPDVLIWSAVVASCAVPLAFPAGHLYYRDTDMSVHQIDHPVGHLDGSIYGDIPMERISSEFNVNFFVVCQVNPHVVPFLNTDPVAERWPTYGLWTGCKWLLHRSCLGILSPLKDLDSIPGAHVINALESILRQRYRGDLSLYPVRYTRNLPDIIGCMFNPTHEFMDRAVENGRKEAERMLSKVHAVLDVEMMLQDLKVQLKTKLKFSKSEEDLHRKALADRMRSRRSYSALSQRGGPRHASTKSLSLQQADVTRARAHRTSQSLELGYMQRNIFAEKIAGSLCGSDECSSTTESDGEHSDHEMDGGLRIAMPPQNLMRFTSNPPSPLDHRRRSYFPSSRSSSRASTSRSSSPGDPLGPMNLRMTPRTPSVRSVSPEQSRRPSTRTRRRWRAEAAFSAAARKIPGVEQLLDMQTRFSGNARVSSYFRKRSLSANGVDHWMRAGPDGEHERGGDSLEA